MNPIEEVAEQIPDLTEYGFGVYGGEKLRSGEAFQRDRDALLGSVERFEAACGWIRENLQQRKSFNYGRTSYGLKHIAEREIGYITNGVFIAAMVHCGYSWQRVGMGPNARFNVSERAVKQVSKRTQNL